MVNSYVYMFGPFGAILWRNIKNGHKDSQRVTEKSQTIEYSE